MIYFPALAAGQLPYKLDKPARIIIRLLFGFLSDSICQAGSLHTTAEVKIAYSFDLQISNNKIIKFWKEERNVGLHSKVDRKPTWPIIKRQNICIFVNTSA